VRGKTAFIEERRQIWGPNTPGKLSRGPEKYNHRAWKNSSQHATVACRQVAYYLRSTMGVGKKILLEHFMRGNNTQSTGSRGEMFKRPNKNILKRGI